MKRTYQPKKAHRNKVHGFRARMQTKGGRNVLARRRNKGRKKLCAQGFIMYSRQYRLKKKYQFNYTYRAGRAYGGKYVVLYVAPSKNKNVKFGISVSKKVGVAVVRNRTKRRISEVLRGLAESINPNCNIVVVARTSCATAQFAAIKADITNLVTKANLLRS